MARGRPVRRPGDRAARGIESDPGPVTRAVRTRDTRPAHPVRVRRRGGPAGGGRPARRIPGDGDCPGHVLGGMGLPHAPTHAVVLPYVLALNAPATPAAADRMARAMSSGTALAGPQALRRRLDAPRALRDCGFDEARIPAAVEAVLPAVPDTNPVAVTARDLHRLLYDVWEGNDPR
ncbi:iron-containing alcohol dehydrogenase [Actinoplanes sp. NPDC051513]|uniref:iron-containing alcohol dehydrogenase n=1 Tax=Actinoplanes sp. NPDC051513 TaxID=3363908 RepID=UPI0037980844